MLQETRRLYTIPHRVASRKMSETIYAGIPPGGVNIYDLPSEKLVDGIIVIVW